MLTLNNMDENTKKVFGHWVYRLFNCYKGSEMTYEMLTQGIEEKSIRDEMWKVYDQAFDDRILQPIMEVLHNNNCGLAESCLVLLKMLEIVGDRVEQIEKSQQRDEFWKEKFTKGVIM